MGQMGQFFDCIAKRKIFIPTKKVRTVKIQRYATEFILGCLQFSNGKPKADLRLSAVYLWFTLLIFGLLWFTFFIQNLLSNIAKIFL